uniref:non-specific serine/threonine protein kinase n=1 Tax=Percolomonas cosmopolitus TaxID=63605 RepID=A0A7S1KMS3_9EUKA
MQFHDYFVLQNEDDEWSTDIDDSFQDFYATLSNQLHVMRNVDNTRHSPKQSVSSTEHTIYQFDSMPVNVYVFVDKHQKFFKKKLILAVPPQIYQPTADSADGVVYIQCNSQGLVTNHTSDDLSEAADTNLEKNILTLSPYVHDSKAKVLATSKPEVYHVFPIPQDAKLINYPLPDMDFHPAQLKLLPSSRGNNFSEDNTFTPTDTQSLSHNQQKKTGLHALRKFRKFESLPSLERLPMITMGSAAKSRQLDYWKHQDDSEHEPLLLLSNTPHDFSQNSLNAFILSNIWWMLLTLLGMFALGGLLFYLLHTRQLKQMELNSQQQLQELHEQQQLLLSKQKAAMKEKLKESIALHSRVKDTEKVKQIGPLVIHKKKVIGRGSNGTVVFEGELSQRKVAVKRMLKDFHEHIHNEISILIESDEHKHVVRYFAKEEDDLFIYLALELCPCTLDEAIEMHEEDDNAYALNERMLLTQLVEAVHHIHSLNIVHRDIKPQNVLLDSNYHIKLSDMGLGKRIDKERSSFTMGSLHKGAGSIGWHAPEVFQNLNTANADVDEQSLRRLTKKVDIFSLGCVMHYVLSQGEHPYGNPSHRESNIMKGKYDLRHLRGRPDYVSTLIKKMIEPNPKKRYSIEQVMKHPYFWDDEKKLRFLCDVSDELGKEREGSVVFKELEKKKKQIAGVTRKSTGWDSKLDAPLLNGVVKFRKYDFQRVWDLLRLIRNVRTHYREYDQSLKTLLAPYPEGVFLYFDRVFPQLFSVVFSSVSKYWRHREVFELYF